MRLSLGLSIILVIFSVPAFAGPCDFESQLKAITRNPHAQVMEGEKRIAGTILQNSEQLPSKLEDGFYVYLIDSKGRIVYSPRAPDLQHLENPLATHRAMTEKLRAEFPGEEPQVLAAGEFEISHGKVSELNNKANTYHGNQTHLKYAEDVFSKRGLKIEPGTKRVDYASVTPATTHATELSIVRMQIRHAQDPAMKQMALIYRQFETDVYHAYPGSIPGKPDWNAFISSKHLQLSPVHKGYEDLSDTEFEILQLLSQISNGREFDYYLEKLIPLHASPETLSTTLRSFEGSMAN